MLLGMEKKMTCRVSNNSHVSSMLAVPALVATNTARALVRTRAITVAVLVLLGLSLIACGGSSSKSTSTPPATVAVATNVPTATMSANGAQTFTATVTGSTNTAVTWSVQEANGGTITQAGVYTAPSTAGTYHVLATSQADPTKVATIAVTVTAAVVAAPNPTFTSTPPTTLAEADPTYTYPITATVSDGSAISYVLTTGPSGAAINTPSTLSWMPTGVAPLTGREMPSSFTVTAKTTNGGSATQSWTVTPFRVVTMTLSDSFWASNGPTPAPLKGVSPVAAIVPGSPSATTITATDNGDGTYTMDSVPAGYYWMEDGPTEKYWTNLNSFDASTDYIGQLLEADPSAQTVTITTLPLDATGSSGSVNPNDVIWIGSPQTTAWWAPQGTAGVSPLPTTGASMTDTETIALGALPVINSGLSNDPSYILQFSPASISGGAGTVGYVGMSIAADAGASLGTGFTYASPIGATDALTDTTPQTLKFTTTNWGKLIPSATYTLSGGTSQARLVYFGTYLASMPYITTGLSAIGGGFPSCSGSTGSANTVPCTEVAGLAGWPAYTITAPDPAILGIPHEQNTREAGNDAGPLFMAYAALDSATCTATQTTDCTPPDDDTVSMPVHNPFGSTPMVLSSQVEIQVPLGYPSNFSTISTSQFSVTSLSSAIVDQPVIYPVTAPMINTTHSLFTSTTLAAPLTLSWTASTLNPAITGGVISGYHVLVYEAPSGSSNWGATLADLGTANTSLTLPTLGLPAGTYVFVIQANADPLATPTSNPWHSALPRGTAQIVSAPITITGSW